MKIDEYVPESVPTSSAKAKSFSVSPPNRNSASTGSSVQKLVASERDDHLAHRAVDDLRERRARHARHVLADPVEHDDRVVEREAQDGEQRRDRRRRHLPADEGVDARRDQEVVHQRDQHRHGELPLEPQRDVDRDHDSEAMIAIERGVRHGLAERRPDLGRPRARRATPNSSSSACVDLRRSCRDSSVGDLDDVRAELLVVDRLDLRVAEARPARSRRGPARRSPACSSAAVIRVPDSKSMPKFSPLRADRQRADQQDHARHREEPLRRRP